MKGTKVRKRALYEAHMHVDIWLGSSHPNGGCLERPRCSFIQAFFSCNQINFLWIETTLLLDETSYVSWAHVYDVSKHGSRLWLHVDDIRISVSPSDTLFVPRPLWIITILLILEDSICFTNVEVGKRGTKKTPVSYHIDFVPREFRCRYLAKSYYTWFLFLAKKTVSKGEPNCVVNSFIHGQSH